MPEMRQVEMTSHPNYQGYDATRGKPNIRIVSSELAESLNALGAEDLPEHCPATFLPQIEAVRVWCLHKGFRFAISPYEWQIAKVFGDGFTIVLWNSRMKKAKERYIKAAFEGFDRPITADTVMQEIQRLI